MEIDSLKIKEYLLSLQDVKYRDFSSSLIMDSKYKMIGVRLPILRNVTKSIKDKELFLNICDDEYFEEVMLQGFVIGLIKDEILFDKYFDNYIKKIDNWSLCDSFCSSIKIVKNRDKYFNKAISLTRSNDDFIIRVGLIIIKDYFIEDKYLKKIFNMLNNIKIDSYYVNMAEAWLLCDLYIKYKDDTIKFLDNHKLNDFTVNKMISKIHDSYRVNKCDKEYVNKYKVTN